MTVLNFPSTPSTQAVLAVVYKLAEQFPRWELECHVDDEWAQPSVSAEHRTAGGFLSAHWAPSGWAVLTEDLAVVSHAPDLSTALSRALG